MAVGNYNGDTILARRRRRSRLENHASEDELVEGVDFSYQKAKVMVERDRGRAFGKQDDIGYRHC